MIGSWVRPTCLLKVSWRVRRQLQFTLRAQTLLAASLGSSFYHVDTGAGKCHRGVLPLARPWFNSLHAPLLDAVSQELKNILEEINSRDNATEEWINELEDEDMEITEAEQKNNEDKETSVATSGALMFTLWRSKKEKRELRTYSKA